MAHVRSMAYKDSASKHRLTPQAIIHFEIVVRTCMYVCMCVCVFMFVCMYTCVFMSVELSDR